MRIVSLNCWGGRIYKPLLRWLQAVNADVYCLQEVMSSTSGVSSHPGPEGQRGEPPVRPDLFGEIEKVLPGHFGFFWPSSRRYIHDRKTVDFDLFFGIATFVKRSIPILANHSEFVFGEYTDLPHTPPPRPRNAHAIRVYDDRSRKPITIAHMHGLWVPEGKGDTPERELQARNFARIIANTVLPGEAIVACGDFNVLPGSVTLHILSNTLALLDLIDSYKIPSTRTSHYINSPRHGGKAPDLFADYMMVAASSPTSNMGRFEVVHEPEVSDHCPLVLDIE